MKKYKLGIIGSGSLGTLVGQGVSSYLSEDYQLLGIVSGKVKNAIKLADKTNSKAYNNLDEMLLDKPDYIVEATTPDVSKEIAVKILEQGINLVILSVGAFADQVFYDKVQKTAKENNCKVHLASGAVGGFDVLGAAMLMEKPQMSIVTEKSPHSFKGAPFLKDKQLSKENTQVIFRGSAKEAIEAFPTNVNVAVATGLATTGVDKIDVSIRSIPAMATNKHTIKFQGDTIDISIAIESKPSKDNPGSSSLAAYSVIALLKKLASAISF